MHVYTSCWEAKNGIWLLSYSSQNSWKHLADHFWKQDARLDGPLPWTRRTLFAFFWNSLFSWTINCLGSHDFPIPLSPPTAISSSCIWHKKALSGLSSCARMWIDQVFASVITVQSIDSKMEMDKKWPDKEKNTFNRSSMYRGTFFILLR